MTEQKIAASVEAMLFASGDPICLDDIVEILGITKIELTAALIDLDARYSAGSGLQLLHFNDKLQLATRKEYSEVIERLLNPVKQRSLSQSALEVLSIIAYKQPVTRGDIEQIRGVKCDYTVGLLEARGLIRRAGHRDTLGRPALFATTDEFLKYFGLTTLSDLPPEEELTKFIQEADLSETEEA